ncbi:pepsin/retropepsin-like aspartic protease family protein [Salegentibacter sp. F188]|uniref:Pepsin/retropepsin-like aspartic protease family protein n=1 Tax=Autumnicola patrickiae TaxID=3075591 RepID=A0ABU3E4J8_9FLAO|nr:pepsin/retropepsin-like aspartic protease family protein [Salegentibacter sp. F188]MDT0690857.1 pepsin/retropepsin-like aspartic protease family protein [Salegentibacter sp. F188]
MKIIRPIYLVVLFLFLTHSIFSQNLDNCRATVKKTFEALNQQSSASIESNLSDDFSIAGQKGEIAKKVLAQLFSQLNDSVIAFKEVDVVEGSNSAEFIYSVEYKKKGPTNSTFLFNKENQLKELSLFEMEVKTLTDNVKTEKSTQHPIEVPFELARKLITVKVNLNGIERTFLLDTGSPRVILNSRYLENSTEETLSSTRDVSNNNISGMDIVQVNNLNFSGITLRDQQVISSNLEHLEESLGINIHGLIGYEMIRDYDILFDYENQKIILIDPESFEKFSRKNLGEDQVILPLHLNGHLPTVQSQIGNRTFYFAIDSGAETNLIDAHLFSQMETNFKKIGTSDLKGGGKNSNEVKTAVLKKMHIGGAKFKNIPTLFSNISHLNKKEHETEINGIIGYPILSRQKTLISHKRKEVIFFY